MTLYLTYPYPCPYLEERTAISGVYDPYAPVDSYIYGELIQYGFRRSGAQLYRPHCPACNACRSLRVPTTAFRPNRSQRRTWRKNQDLQVELQPPEFVSEHFTLYQRYQKARHPGGMMDSDDPTDYYQVCVNSPVDTWHVEFREPSKRLLAVAVTDLLPGGLAAMYTFFDPDAMERSLGTYAILWQLEYARSQRIPHVYLGYWIAECAKMAYKSAFHPAEVWNGHSWYPLDQVAPPTQP